MRRHLEHSKDESDKRDKLRRHTPISNDVYDNPRISKLRQIITSATKPQDRFVYRCVIYATDCLAPKVVPVPIYAETSMLGEPPFDFDDLDCQLFFPRGWKSVRIDNAIGTGFTLRNSIEIAISGRPEGQRENSAIKCTYRGTVWRGNILVALRGQRDESALIQASYNDVELINVLLGLWLKQPEDDFEATIWDEHLC
ncbi:hypothetical protein PLICRDRAFT_171383 [Plicaturopsis crispa FD-325 SS-3]|nr:hypothetical protein PLICRDRAFT_171383 [Plicaturopsis crispa FD-325 SS-3]